MSPSTNRPVPASAFSMQADVEVPQPPPGTIPLPPTSHPVLPPIDVPAEINEPPMPLDHVPVSEPLMPGAIVLRGMARRHALSA